MKASVIKYSVVALPLIGLAAFILRFGQAWQLCSIVFIIYCLYRGARQPNFFNPYYLFIPTFVSLALYTPHMGPRLLTPIAANGAAIILACTAAVVLGFRCMELRKLKPVTTKNYNENFKVIFLIGLLPAVISFVLIGNPMAMSGDDLMEAKDKFTLPLVGQLAYFLQAAIIVACKNNRSKQIMLSIAACVLMSIVAVTKTGMLVTALFVIVGLNRFKPDILHNKYFRKLVRTAWIWLPVLLIAGFIFNNSMRREASGEDEFKYVKRGQSEIVDHKSQFAAAMYLNYMYFCSEWGNVQYNLDHNHNDGHGANTFNQFAKKVGVELHKARKMQPAMFNTHTFLTDFYLDFGYVGAPIASFLLGAIIFCCYRRFGLSNDALLISFYALVAYATVMMFFSNHFIIGYLLNYFITFGGYFLLMYGFKIYNRKYILCR